MPELRADLSQSPTRYSKCYAVWSRQGAAWPRQDVACDEWPPAKKSLTHMWGRALGSTANPLSLRGHKQRQQASRAYRIRQEPSEAFRAQATDRKISAHPWSVQ